MNLLLFLKMNGASTGLKTSNNLRLYSLTYENRLWVLISLQIKIQVVCYFQVSFIFHAHVITSCYRNVIKQSKYSFNRTIFCLLEGGFSYLERLRSANYLLATNIFCLK